MKYKWQANIPQILPTQLPSCYKYEWSSLHLLPMNNIEQQHSETIWAKTNKKERNSHQYSTPKN